VLVHRQVGDAEEERDRDHAEDRERGRCVSAVRTTKCVDAVRDRLHASERRRPGREGAQQNEQRHAAGPGCDRIRRDRMRGGAEERLRQTDRDEREHGRDEGVRRQREREPRFADAAQVDKDDHRQAGE
jgi:hypothetical protein